MDMKFVGTAWQRWRVGGLVVAGLLIISWAATAAQSWTFEGRIVSFECGDNCYLTIKDQFGGQHMGLCVAALCGPWNKETSIPKPLIGRKVVADIGMGTQLNGNGDIMALHMAFKTLRLK